MTAIQALLGINYGVGFEQIKRLEDAVLAGKNQFYTALFQTFEVHKAVSLAGGVPLCARVALYLTPTILALAAKCGIRTSIQDHVGDICFVASVVSCISMIAFGQYVAGAVSLACFIVGLLDRIKVLPENLRHPLHDYSPHVVIVTGLLVGSVFDKLYSLFNLLDYTVKQLQKKKEHPIVVGELTPEKCKEVLHGGMEGLKVNRDYVRLPTMPAVPNIELDWYAKEADKLKWDVALLRKTHGMEGSDFEVTERAKRNVKECISAISHRRIKRGEPTEYAQLISYLKIIAGHVKKENMGDLFIKLASDAQCGSAIYDTVEKAYEEVVLQEKKLTPKEKVLNLLQADRGRFVEAEYQKILLMPKNPLLKMVDLQDRCIFNEFASWYFGEVGYRDGSVKYDSIHVIDPLQKCIIQTMIGDRYKGLFWEQHTLDHVVEVIQNSLPKSDVYTWFRDWGYTQDELTADEPMIYGVTLENAKGQIQPQVIAAMLYGMGVLL